MTLHMCSHDRSLLLSLSLSLSLRDVSKLAARQITRTGASLLYSIGAAQKIDGRPRSRRNGVRSDAYVYAIRSEARLARPPTLEMSLNRALQSQPAEVRRMRNATRAYKSPLSAYLTSQRCGITARSRVY